MADASRSVADHLAAYIADHRLTAGSRLPPERELALQLGISRPALREATRRLIGLGALEPRKGSGTYLADIDHGDLMAVRLQLEPLAASLAARHAGDEQIVELRNLLDAMPRLEADPAAFAEADLGMHAAIAAASGNRFLSGCLSELAAALRLSRARSAASAARRGRTAAELEDVVDAIAARRPRQAATAMRRHLTAVGETLGD
jgi:GntR family transcriptional repressor for pyruvate dehydrogenase complex